jgi:isopentenyl-diphosphate delta-isomerase
MENVILVDERDTPLGTMEKIEAHEKGLLHRAFSVFVFNEKRELLLQQRAAEKYHSPGLWTNTCCSHPRPGELTVDAAVRRMNEEMGFTTELEEVFSFIYRSGVGRGLTEHELDHVLVGRFSGTPVPDPREVMSWRFASPDRIAEELETYPENFTAWFRPAFEKLRDRLKLKDMQAG